MFELNLLNILGYRPSLDGCSRCGAGFDPRGALVQQGGELVCRFCAATGRTISAASLQTLRFCLTTGRFGLVPFAGESLHAAGILLDEALAAHTSRKLKSLEFLQQTCS
jgi:DNA repair protein RecO (recombination protein O)